MKLQRSRARDTNRADYAGDSYDVHTSVHEADIDTEIVAQGVGSDLISALCVDVEDYYHVSAFDPYIERCDWDTYPSRVVGNTFKILDLFAERGVRATFFVLGCVAEKHPDIVRRIVADGHEIASHGWQHQRVTALTKEEFRHDIRRAKNLLEQQSGVAVKGYRAPSYSITDQSLWAHDILFEEGYEYSSSIAPIKHDHYGIPNGPRFAYKVKKDGLIEIPVCTFNYRDKNYPCGGGGWFRLFPYWLTRKALRNVILKDQQPCVFYFHPWEIDPDQPTVKGLDAKTRFRHYVGLSATEGKIMRLLEDFRWGRMDEIYLPQTQNMKVRLPA